MEKKNKVPDNITVNVEIDVKKLCENTGFINLFTSSPRYLG